MTGCESADGGYYAPEESATFSAVMPDGKTWSEYWCEVNGDNGYQTKCTSVQPRNVLGDPCPGMSYLLYFLQLLIYCRFHKFYYGE